MKCWGPICYFKKNIFLLHDIQKLFCLLEVSIDNSFLTSNYLDELKLELVIKVFNSSSIRDTSWTRICRFIIFNEWGFRFRDTGWTRICRFIIFNEWGFRYRDTGWTKICLCIIYIRERGFRYRDTSWTGIWINIIIIRVRIQI